MSTIGRKLQTPLLEVYKKLKCWAVDSAARMYRIMLLKIQHVANQLWDHGQEIFTLLNIRAYLVRPKVITAYHKSQAEWQNTLALGHTNLSNVASTIYTDRIYQFFCSLLKNFTPTTNGLWVIRSKSACSRKFNKNRKMVYIEKRCPYV
jgi:hypothetical protein